MRMISSGAYSVVGRGTYDRWHHVCAHINENAITEVGGLLDAKNKKTMSTPAGLMSV